MARPAKTQGAYSVIFIYNYLFSREPQRKRPGKRHIRVPSRTLSAPAGRLQRQAQHHDHSKQRAENQTGRNPDKRLHVVHIHRFLPRNNNNPPNFVELYAFSRPPVCDRSHICAILACFSGSPLPPILSSIYNRFSLFLRINGAVKCCCCASRRIQNKTSTRKT